VRVELGAARWQRDDGDNSGDLAVANSLAEPRAFFGFRALDEPAAEP